ncbi:MAG: hypothetical protein O2816_19785, partial [Planctomycetota bacterium]|nr:hypothetical protein [Planctomycetota bacterium]
MHGPLRDSSIGVLLLDPDRRSGGKGRVGDPDRWSPPLSGCLELAARVHAACVKLPPAHPPEELAERGALAWVSLDGELKELGLYTGALAEEAAPREAWAL